MPIAEIIEKTYLFIIGASVFFGALYLVYYRDSHAWRYLTRFYGHPWQHPAETRRFQHAVMYGKGIAAKSYNGLLTIGIHETGVALRPIPPFSFFHKPLFIPYSELTGWQQIWYLNTKSVELTFERAPEVKLVMPADQAHWLQKASGNKMEIHEQHSPHKKRPNIWYAIIIVQGLSALALAAYILIRT